MPRFLHTADWQIGRQYSQFPMEDGALLAEARLEAVATLARLATEHAVDAVLVAGDVFDAQAVSERTLRRLFAQLAGYAGPWLMIPGNHDAALAESVWTCAQRIGAVPSNVHLALAPCVLDFASRGFMALAAPLTQRHTYNDLTEWFDSAPTTDGLLRIGLAHGCVQGLLAESIDSTNPIGADRARLARLDYLALGDWHGCRQVDERTWYSGTPEADRFRDNDPGFALLVDIEAPGALPVVTRIETGRFRWRALEATLSVASDVDRLAGELAGVQSSDVVSLRVAGQVDLQALVRLRAAIDLAHASVRHLQADLSLLRLMPTAADIATLDADGYLGDVIAELRDAQSDGTRPEAAGVAAEALNLLATLLLEGRGQAPAP
jgi:DNA repair exonuclease SbcCD nuclease subunit